MNPWILIMETNLFVVGKGVRPNLKYIYQNRHLYYIIWLGLFSYYFRRSIVHRKKDIKHTYIQLLILIPHNFQLFVPHLHSQPLLFYSNNLTKNKDALKVSPRTVLLLTDTVNFLLFLLISSLLLSSCFYFLERIMN